MNVSRLVRLVWCLAAFAPVEAVLHQWNGRRALASLVVYALGWIAIGIATRRDPDGERLRLFVSNHTFVLAFVTLVGLQWLLLKYPGHWILFLALVLATWILWVWALTDSPRALAVNLARHTLIAISLGMALLAIEGGLWLLDKRRPPNDGATVTWGHRVRYNRFQFREREFASPKPAGVFRVMVVGDSFTWGAGLSEEERYTNLMETDLSRRFPDRKIEVLNFGAPGGPTTLERDVIRRHMHDVDPDLIVVGFCINDPQPNRGDYAIEIERYRAFFRVTRLLESLNLKRTAWFLDARFTNALRAQGKIPPWLDALDRAYDRRSREWQEFHGALAEIKQISDTHRLPPPIFLSLLYGDGDYAKPNAELAHYLRWSRQATDEAARIGFHVLSLEEEFKAEGHKVRRVNPWDEHPSRECQIAYARKLTEATVPLLSSSSAP